MRLYNICKLMKWSHLPITGGLYAQHPKMLDDFLIIAQIEANAEKRRQKKREAEMSRKGSSPKGRRAGRRR